MICNILKVLGMKCWWSKAEQLYIICIFWSSAICVQYYLCNEHLIYLNLTKYFADIKSLQKYVLIIYSDLCHPAYLTYMQSTS